jgi:hypothetical protein
MRTITIITVVAVSLVVMGCGNGEQLEADLANANAKVTVLDSTLTATQIDLRNARTQAADLERSLQATQGERDSLAELNASTAARAGRLRAELGAARERYQRSMDSLSAHNAALRLDIDRWKSEMEVANMQIRATERHANDLIRTRDSLYAFVDAVYPWYQYYKHEAGRNWAKKLFGAGRADTPSKAEPVFGSEGTGQELEALQP